MPGFQYMPGAWHVDRISERMAPKQRPYSVVLKLQALEVAEKTSKEAGVRRYVIGSHYGYRYSGTPLAGADAEISEGGPR